MKTQIENFRTLLERIIAVNGADTLKNGEYVERFAYRFRLKDQNDLKIIADMEKGKVFELLSEGTDASYEEALQILKDAGHPEDECRTYLDTLRDVLKTANRNMETENEKTLKKANSFVFGRGVVQDYQQAAFLYNRAAAMESPEGKFIVLMSATKDAGNDFSQILEGKVKEKISPERYRHFTEYVDLVEGDEEAFELLKECAQENCPEAQYLLGKCYGLQKENPFVFRFIGPDAGKAEKWIQMAENNGFTEDLNEEEKKDAIINANHPDLKSLKELAEEGYAEAQIRYAETFSSDNEERFVWMRKAADQGNTSATRKLALLYDTSDDRDNCMKWLKKAASLSDPEAMYLLGCEYMKSEFEDGTVNPDFDEITGENLIQKAAVKGNFDAINKIRKLEKWSFGL